MKKTNKNPKATKKPFMVELEEQSPELREVEFIPEPGMPDVDIKMDENFFGLKTKTFEILVLAPPVTEESEKVEDVINREDFVQEMPDINKENEEEQIKPKESKKPVLTYKERLESIKARLNKHRK